VGERDGRAAGRFDCTVVVLTCNRPDLLDVALGSLARQTEPITDVIVSDDTPGDEAHVLVDRYPTLGIRYRRGPRAGQSANLRSALSLVDTPFVTILHDDDWTRPVTTCCSRSPSGCDA